MAMAFLDILTAAVRCIKLHQNLIKPHVFILAVPGQCQAMLQLVRLHCRSSSLGDNSGDSGDIIICDISDISLANSSNISLPWQ